MTWEQMAGEGNGKLGVAEVKKLIEILERLLGMTEVATFWNTFFLEYA